MKNVRQSACRRSGGGRCGATFAASRTMKRFGLVLLGASVLAACAPKDDAPGTTPAGTGGGTATGGKAGGGGTGGGGTGTGGTGNSGLGGTTATGGQGGTGNPGVGGAGTGGAGPSGGGAGGGSGGTGNVDAGGTGGATADAGAGGAGGGGGDSKFSFFVVSMKALQILSGKTEGFGGDLRFGKADGLSGADEICKRAAEMGLPGAGQKNWHAYLSAAGTGGQAVNARDRIGKGPWYDRKDRLLALNLTDLFSGDRPKGDAQLVNDITNERGEPNHYVGANGFNPSQPFDTHDTLTGSTAQGMLGGFTCDDWTSTTAVGRPMIGHSWPRSATNGRQWSADHAVPGCTAGLDRTLGGTGSGSCVGCSGGYGGFYCFVAQ
jgi:hypothetical protein